MSRLTVFHCSYRPVQVPIGLSICCNNRTAGFGTPTSCSFIFRNTLVQFAYFCRPAHKAVKALPMKYVTLVWLCCAAVLAPACKDDNTIEENGLRVDFKRSVTRRDAMLVLRYLAPHRAAHPFEKINLEREERTYYIGWNLEDTHCDMLPEQTQWYSQIADSLSKHLFRNNPVRIVITPRDWSYHTMKSRGSVFPEGDTLHAGKSCLIVAPDFPRDQRALFVQILNQSPLLTQNRRVAWLQQNGERYAIQIALRSEEESLRAVMEVQELLDALRPVAPEGMGLEVSLTDCVFDQQYQTLSGMEDVLIEEIPAEAEAVAPDTEVTITPAENPGTASEEALYDPAVTPPKPVNLDKVRKDIGYPPDAIAEGAEGVVTVRVMVDTYGNYLSHKVVKDAHPALVRAVEAHIAEVQYSPARKSGNNVAYWITIPFRFQL